MRGGGDLRALAARYQSALAGLPGLDIVPLPWLHLTMQNVAFTDEISEQEADAVLASAQELCRQLQAFELTFNEAEVRREAIALRPSPAEPVVALRDAVRTTIDSVLGTIPEAPEHAHGFEPHVSVAYSNQEGPSAPYVSAVSSARPITATVGVVATKLIVLDRDARVYRWSTYGDVPLGQ